MIENRNLTPGTKLVARYHKQRYICVAVEGEGGKLRYRLEDGREFKSPSAAGTAITGHTCNGWSFWRVEAIATTPASETTQDPPLETQSNIETTEAEPSEDTQPDVTRKGLFRTPNQKGLPEDQTRWYCPKCGESFLSSSDEIPETCPQGHTG